MSALLSVTILLNGTLVDGTGAPPVRDACIEIRDGRIATIGRASTCVVEAGAWVLDAMGKWVIPGLIDTHTHLFDSGSLYTSPDDYDLTARVPHETERTRIRARIGETTDRFLCSGITTVASLGGPRWEADVRDETKAPRILTAGPFLAGFPVGEMTLWTREDPVLVQVASPQEARGKVDELVGRDVDLVKAGFLDEPVLRALVDEAHARQMKVAIHAEELEAAKMALHANVDVLAHTVVDQLVDEVFLAQAKKQGVVSITGLAHYERYRQVLDSAVKLSPIEERCGDPEVIATWSDLGELQNKPATPDSIRWGASPAARDLLLGNVRRMHAAGIPIAVGSNGGNIGTLQGPSYHRELTMLAEAGLTPNEVLTCATANGALALGVLGDRGTVEVGKLADLVVLGADPTKDVSSLASVETVLVGGEVVYLAPSKLYKDAP
ncbi:MAG TPA: amidohydrolase family protein [Vicinamibacteria bacterium]|nr:amidohydrolase family protein [Vicinamibacteria bacterium]